MFGEGFDLPQLKIAAMHDIHKTLPITLQFVGRFVRQAQNVGDAAVVVNLADPQVDSELQSLYAEDPDWNELLKRSSERRIAREVSLQEFIGSFTGELPRQLPLWNLRPTFSTVVYSTNTLTWNPSAIVEAFPKNTDAWHAVSEKERVAIVVIARREDVKWGRYQNIQDHLWHLVVVHWDMDRNLLFVSASNYSAVNILAIAKAVGGSSVVLVNGTKVFRVFGGIERPMVRNLGASKTGMISFTMYFGPEVSSGLSEVEKAQSDLNNLLAWGYEGGERITRGCSARKGKFWSIDGGPVMDWKEWCRRIGEKIQDDTISDIDVIKGFLRPVELDSRPVIVPIAAEWGERVVREEEERVSVFIGGQEFKLHEVSLGLVDVSDSGPIRMEVSAGSIRSNYDLVIEKDSKGRGRCSYRLFGAKRVELQVGRRPRMPLDEWCEADPILIHYANGSFSYNQYFVDAPCDAAFDKELIDVRDWTGTNIKVESQGKERKRESIQFAIAQSILEDFDVVIDDDGSYEAADLIALRREGENEITLRLIHCKYSGESSVGARVNDLYELCGQAQKCIRWKHMGMAKLVAHIKKREQQWQAEHNTRFIKGAFRELRHLEKAARHSRVSLEVCIVQPGLGKSVATDAVLHLLGSTELFLKKTCDARFQVVGSA